MWTTDFLEEQKLVLPLLREPKKDFDISELTIIFEIPFLGLGQTQSRILIKLG